MAESPDERGVIVFGGRSSSVIGRNKKLLELRVGAEEWTTLNVSLKKRRSNHVVIPLT